jgi:uncharacterized membrane protein
MRLTGHLVFALCMVGWGILSLIYGDFAMNWQPVPPGIPGYTALAYLSGVMLLVGGVGLLARPTMTGAGLLLTLNLLVWLLLLQVPRVIMGGRHEAAWLGMGETLVLVSGAWTLFAASAADEDRLRGWLARHRVRLGSVLFALALLPIGLSHFVYADVTAQMTPSYFPLRLDIAWLTGAAHIAAGLAILFGVLPRLAALLEAVMMSGFTLLIWLPGVVAAPANRFQWTALFASAALSGAAWAVAGILNGEKVSALFPASFGGQRRAPAQ